MKISFRIIGITDIQFSCFYCEYFDSNTLAEVYTHWKSHHKSRSGEKPFLFHASTYANCYYCDYINTYKNLKTHCIIEHPNDAFVIILYGMKCSYCQYRGDDDQLKDHHSAKHSYKDYSIDNPKNTMKCALCDYSTGVKSRIADHFLTEHEIIIAAEPFNLLPISKEHVNELLALNIYKKRKCGYCQRICETKYELEKHHAKRHSKSALNMEKVYDNGYSHEICSMCGPYNSRKANLSFLKHFKHHSFNFNCTKCYFHSNDMVEYVVHNKQHHQWESLNFQCLAMSDQLEIDYWKSQIVFGNGLVLYQHSLLNTKYDDSSRFKAMLERWLNSMKKQYFWEVEGIELKDSDEETDNGYDFSENASMVSYDCDDRHSVEDGDDENKLKQQNEYANHVVVVGIPYKKGEDLRHIFSEILLKIGIPLDEDDVAHIRRHRRNNSLVLVQLRSYQIKMQIIDQTSTRIQIDAKIDSVKIKAIFINSHMTYYYREMSKILSSAFKDQLISYYNLTKSGFVVQQHQDAQHVYFTSKDKLSDFIQQVKSEKKSDATAAKSSRRSKKSRKRTKQQHYRD